MNKFCLYPLKNFKVWELYKKQISSFWTPEEIDFSKDYDDFKQLTETQQHTIKMILAFFSNSDGLVNFNIQSNFMNSFDTEITYTYVFQMFMEQIHNETYSLMIETLIRDEEEKNKLFNSISTIPIINKISEWGLLYSKSEIPLIIKVLVYLCFEGIMFSGAFAVIYWFKKYIGGSKLSGLIKSNEFISRDEGFHVEFGTYIFNNLNIVDKLTNRPVYEIIKKAVKLTNEFNQEVLKVKEIGINSDMMEQYTQFIADRLLVEIGYNKYYNAKNPFSFMDTIGMIQKTNFHESRPTEYRKADFKEDLNINDDF